MTETPAPGFSRWIGPVGSAVLLVVLFGAAAALGRFEPSADAGKIRVATVAGAFWTLLVGGGLPLAYLLGAVGLGRIAAPLFKGSASRLWLQAAAGMGLMLWVSHLLGMVGLLSGRDGAYAAWGAVALGLVLLIDQVVRGELRPENWPIAPAWMVVATPAVALMFAAACSPPGWLWESEKGGYDVLSYHLQLVREWSEGDRLWPVAHNVYSFLPSYVESAFLHLGAMQRIGESARPAAMGSALAALPPAALIDGSGVAVMSCQFLHAGMGVLTALLVGRAVWVVVRRAAGEERGAGARFAGVVAAALFLGIPWVIVVGSMAYNELAVTAMGAGALLAAVDPDLASWRCGVVSGLLVGMACSAKPTAAFMVAPWVGVVLLGLMPVRAWPAACALGALAVAAAVAPWLIRNELAAHNPVFPFAASILGSGHWSAEQVARYASAHHESGGVVERLGLLFSSDRGVRHEQWSIVFPVGLVALAIAAASARMRRVALLLGGGVLAAVVGWLWLTHLQSRFLVPLAVPMAVLVGLAVGAILAGVGVGGGRGMRVAIRLACAALPLALAGRSAILFVGQRDGQPNAVVIGGVASQTGATVEDQFFAATDQERAVFLSRVASPQLYANLALEPDATVYLLGDSTPLYYRVRTVYATTWDRSPLGVAMERHPDDDVAWRRALAETGAGYVVVNFAELDRLRRDGWYDPAVTMPRVQRFIERWCEPVRQWPATGQVLMRLRPIDVGPASTMPPTGERP